MSLSSLSSQLASLNNSNSSNNKNVGISYTTSKRHDDSIGRGISHSTTYGYSTSSSTSRDKYKPSILYNDAKEASDIPLTTIRENCVSSIQQLYKLTGGSSEFFVSPKIKKLIGTSSLEYERGLHTSKENEQTDVTINKLLLILGTTIMDGAGSNTNNNNNDTTMMPLTLTSSLHVIEYLLRKYDIHTRTNTSEQLLKIFIPYHENSPLFLRVLQLIDLTSFGNTWIFLRPFTATTTQTSSASIISRMILSKAVSKDNTLLEYCCNTIQNVTRLHIDETTKPSQSQHGTHPPPPIRKGISLMISFYTAVIIEALSIQITNPMNSGSISESSLRILLPYVISALCSSSDNNNNSNDNDANSNSRSNLGYYCSDYRNFGRIMAVTINEKCVNLSKQVCGALLECIVKGSVEQHGEGQRSDDDHYRIESVVDTILTLIPILSSSSNSTDNDNDNITYSTLTIIRQGERRHNLGYTSLTPKTFNVLMKHDSNYLVKALGYIYNEQDHSTSSVITLMCSLLSLALKELPRELEQEQQQRKQQQEEDAKKKSRRKKPSSSSKKKKISSSSLMLKLILDLIREESLRDAWLNNKKVNLISSFTYEVVSSFSNLAQQQQVLAPNDDGDDDENDNNNYMLDAYKSILDTLRFIESSSCDAGIAYAVNVICDTTNKKKKKKMKKKKREKMIERKKRIILLLGLSSDTTEERERNENDEGAITTTMDIDDDNMIESVTADKLLPPRVALEHPDESVRLNAIERLMNDLSESSEDHIHTHHHEGIVAVGGGTDALTTTRDNCGRRVGESSLLEEVLLHRLNVEDNVHVAATAGVALEKLLKKERIKTTTKFPIVSFATTALSALCKWSIFKYNFINSNEQPAVVTPLQKKDQEEESSAKKKKKKKKDKRKSSSSKTEEKVEEESLAIKAASQFGLSDDRLTALDAALNAAAYAVNGLLAKDGSGGGSIKHHHQPGGDVSMSPLLQSLIQAIAAHLDFAVDDMVLLQQKGDEKNYAEVMTKIINSASNALRLAVVESRTRKCESTSFENAKMFLTTNQVCTRALHACNSSLDNIQEESSPSPSSSNTPDEEKSKVMVALKHRYMWITIFALTESLEKSKTKEFVSTSLETAFCVLKSYGTTKFSEREVDLLVRCFKVCAQGIAADTVPDIIINLSSVQSMKAYEQVSLPTIRVFCESVVTKDNYVSPISVVMEVATRFDVTDRVIKCLLEVAIDYISCDTAIGPTYGIIPAITLLGHTDQEVRKAALRLLSATAHLLNDNGRAQTVKEEYRIMRNLCQVVNEDHDSGFHSSLLMDGESAIPKFLSMSLQEVDDSAALQECIIRHCYFTAVAYGTVPEVNLNEKTSLHDCGWLPFGQAYGGCRATASVLNALELAGETAFPLSLRWERIGKDIFQAIFMASKTLGTEMAPPLQILLNTIVLMLKGVVVNDSSSLHNIVISTGPTTSGRRRRSYSVGNVDGVSFVDPYPEEMLNSIIMGTTKYSRSEVCDAVVQNVLGSNSWSEGIFKQLPPNSRRNIAGHLLELRSRGTVASASNAFLGLSMTASDVSYLFQTKTKENLDLVTFLIDWIRANCSNLDKSDDPGQAQLFNVLFELLAGLSSKSKTTNMSTFDVEESEYTRISILQTLLKLSQGLSKQNTESNNGDLTRFVNLIVRLVGEAKEEDSLVWPLVSSRSRSSALSLLTNLSSQYPTAVLGSLIPTLLTIMISGDDDSPRASNTAGEAFNAVIPVYCQHVEEAGLSLLHLLNAFIAKSRTLPEKSCRLKLYGLLVKSFGTVDRTNANVSPYGSLVVAFLANEVFHSESDQHNDMEDAGPVSFALDVLQFASASDRVSSLLQLLSYSNELLMKIGSIGSESKLQSRSTTSDGGEAMEVTCDDIERIVLEGASQIVETNKTMSGPQVVEYTEQERYLIMKLIVDMLTIVMETLSVNAVRKLIRRSDGSLSALSLQLWQDLLQVQATAVNAQGSESQANNNEYEKSFWVSSGSIITESLDVLQNVLPVHLFLAAASALIREENAEGELRGRAILLLGQRAPEIEPNSAEASLFLDMVPLLTEHLNTKRSDTSVGEQTKAVLKQSSLIAIEQLARALSLPSSLDSSAGIFLPALESVTSILNENSSESEIRSNLDNTAATNVSVQLLCSASLCASTLVRLLKARCLPTLPKLLGSLLQSLSVTNSHLLTKNPGSNTSKVLLQESIFRSLIAISETLPQFLGPYLSRLLSPSGLPSVALRQDDNEQDLRIKSIVERLEKVLSTNTPCRQLIPAIGKAALECIGQLVESKALLSMLKSSIQSSSRSDVSAQKKWILKTITLSYEHISGDLISSANEVLLVLVLKLSEAQLRPLYTKLREWRGDFDEANTNSAVANARRHAFWSLSASLSKTLKSIFLPCLSTVVSDAVEELEYAVSKLCRRKSSEKLDGGKKKRRLKAEVDGDESFTMESLRTLQPILLCLEVALKSDAHEGGNWTRADDGQRFNLLLAPLGKLLQCKVPSDFPFSSFSEKISPFQHIVQGNIAGERGEDCGNVIGCMTGLASAAGNEQLWKPLNHSVLDACGNENRSEVRKAGISCLLSLMKTLGEEYMVLLPECLPTISELLEDNDEETVALAQEWVSLGEDLLGESLQDSLK